MQKEALTSLYKYYFYVLFRGLDQKFGLYYSKGGKMFIECKLLS